MIKDLIIMKNRLILIALFLCCCFVRSGAENYPYRSDVLWVTVPDHADWLYKTGENAVVDVQFYRYGIPEDAVVEYTVADDMMKGDVKGTVKLSRGRARVSIGTRKTPGFRGLRLTVAVGGN